jgi:hypothetical protein
MWRKPGAGIGEMPERVLDSAAEGVIMAKKIGITGGTT